MGVNVRKTQAMVKPLNVSFEGDTIHVKYRPHAYTPDFEERSRIVDDEATAGMVLGTMLVALVAEWDVTDSIPVMDDEGNQRLHPDTGEPLFDEEVVPLTVAALRTVPLTIQTTVLDAISTEMRPGKSNAPNSVGSF